MRPTHTLGTWQTQSNTNQPATQAQHVQLATTSSLATPQGMCNCVSCADIFANLSLTRTVTLTSTVALTGALPQ